MSKEQKNKTSVACARKPTKKEIVGMIDKGVFDKFILKDISKATGIKYKELK